MNFFFSDLTKSSFIAISLDKACNLVIIVLVRLYNRSTLTVDNFSVDSN